MNNKKSIKILKSLIAHNNDRIACYELVLNDNETLDQELKTMFTHLVQVSKKIREELSNEVRKSGGVPPEDGREGSKFLSAWSEVRKALEKNEHLGIVIACEQCEQVIINAYEKVLSDHEEDLASIQQIEMINTQLKLLKVNLKEIHDSKGQLAVHK
jgi:uncharacterized protein (TIGR02284 family)